MKTDKKTYGRDYFADKLADYISVRHPDVASAGRLIARRSRTAHGVFLRALGSGRSLSSALGDADRILYHGLIFSRFDMVCTILETEFPRLGGRKRRDAAMRLLPWCGEVFGRYPLDDDFYSDPAVRQLYDELSVRIREYFDVHEI